MCSKILYENTSIQSEPEKSNQNSKLENIIIKYSGGLISNKTQATYLLLGLFFLSLFLSVYLLSANSNDLEETPELPDGVNMGNII